MARAKLSSWYVCRSSDENGLKHKIDLLIVVHQIKPLKSDPAFEAAKNKSFMGV